MTTLMTVLKPTTTNHKTASFREWGLFAAFSVTLLTGCASDSPLEGYNRGMYKINKTVDKYTLEPAAKAYKAVTPDPVERSVDNFFSNIGEINTVANSVLQGKLHNATVSGARIVWNTTLGLGGLFDVATAMDLQSDPEDFGQTLRKWGVPAGPYIILPLLGPSTLTDTAGRAGDFMISPYAHYDWNDHYTREGVTILRALNTRSKLLSLSSMLDNVGTDEYSFVKSGYLQRRENLVRDGKNEGKIDEAFDELFFEEVLEQ